MLSFLKQLHYYAVAMRQRPYAPVACPHCGRMDNPAFLRMDRYLLPVHIAMCEGCGLIYTSQNFSGEALHAFYRDDYRRFYENAQAIGNDYLFLHKPKLIASYRFSRIRDVVGPFQNVLEIGSGLGFFLNECRAAGVHAKGLELGDPFRHYAQKTLALGAAVSEERYETIARLNPAPDVIALFHVFEHLEDPAGCVRWMAGQLAPGGSVVIEVPDMTGDWSYIGLGQFHTAHRCYFTPTSLSNMLAANGLIPYAITRESGDGIYPGNLRVFARAGSQCTPYPLPADDRDAMLQTIGKNLRRSDYLRAARRLIMQAWRGRRG